MEVQNNTHMPPHDAVESHDLHQPISKDQATCPVVPSDHSEHLKPPPSSNPNLPPKPPLEVPVSTLQNHFFYVKQLLLSFFLVLMCSWIFHCMCPIPWLTLNDNIKMKTCRKSEKKSPSCGVCVLLLFMLRSFFFGEYWTDVDHPRWHHQCSFRPGPRDSPPSLLLLHPFNTVLPLAVSLSCWATCLLLSSRRYHPLCIYYRTIWCK